MARVYSRGVSGRHTLSPNRVNPQSDQKLLISPLSLMDFIATGIFIFLICKARALGLFFSFTSGQFVSSFIRNIIDSVVPIVFKSP